MPPKISSHVLRSKVERAIADGAPKEEVKKWVIDLDKDLRVEDDETFELQFDERNRLYHKGQQKKAHRQAKQ